MARTLKRGFMKRKDGSLWIEEFHIPQIPSGTVIRRWVWSYDTGEWLPLSAADEEFIPAEPESYAVGHYDEWGN
jgi:hypothetical protein